jgi:hypothetical protein
MWRAPDPAVKYGPLPRDTMDARDTEGHGGPDEQRRRARRLGAVLVLVVVLIVAAVFAWKLSLTR